MTTSTDTTDAMPVIQAMAERLRDEYGAEAVILYGSRADGRARADSDIDLMIIKSDTSGSTEHFKKARAVLSDLADGLWLDTRTYTPDAVERTLAKGDHFVQDIILRGLALHKGADFAKYIKLAEESYNMNPQDSEYPEDWIAVAEEDFEMFRILIETGHPRGAAYNLQQAVEKFFKAYLIRQGWRLKRTHDLVELLDDAVEYDATLEEFRAICKLVTKYSAASRYPASPDSDLPDMSDESVRAAANELAPLIERLRAGSERTNIDEQDSHDIEGGK